ncbi:DUF4314 domain-containing protein [Desulfitobacterium hafniense]|uniref:DUF4314 domain-containing protein n=2 Tax=Desulfitobacterium hafniense TaxID=49338 RepID=Q252D3_DESHY|nr:DUF4314 domain-containing protein [Desulfitobacterium hafniense]KTE90711.1 hypothetical protein AT727_24175 [Desulfitobacterium hafniense]BAE81859.1 hypothetical protein DSY0070 [Desulfitobacterium hafniense Y51]
MRDYQGLLKFVKEQYPPGTRIRLIEMQDPYAPVPPGTEGEVDFIDDAAQIHMKWSNGRSLALIPGVDRFTVIPQHLQTLKLYMPLAVMQYERDELGSLEEYPSELDQGTVLSYHDQILAAILKERTPEKTERGLMKYYHEDDGVGQKVKSLFFTVEQVGSKLMGVAECRVQGDLGDAELEQLKDYVSGQASDGFGEGFEQHPIKVGSDELYVSLWTASKGWSISTKDELEATGQQMGGMQLG